MALTLMACATKPINTPSDNEIASSIHNYKTNQACIDIIKDFEGVRLSAYTGPGGHLLIGYGHKADVFEGMTITPERAEEILKADLIEVEENVSRLVKVKVNENQFSALVCLAYNIGWGNFGSSTLLTELNKGDYAEAARQFDVWRMVNNQVNSHQVKRRAHERAIFEG